MANEEHLEILKKGVGEWNRWREENPGVVPDLSKAELRSARLAGANLAGANLAGANLTRANLTRANLHGASLVGANLVGARLNSAHLFAADLVGANLEQADPVGANLEQARLVDARLVDARLVDARLDGARLDGARLDFTTLHHTSLVGARLVKACLNYARLDGTRLDGTRLDDASLTDAGFVDVDLRQVKGLESVQHWGPSHVSTSTLERSRGQIPEEFLKGCGLSDWEIEAAKLYDPDLSEAEITTISYELIMEGPGEGLVFVAVGDERREERVTGEALERVVRALRADAGGREPEPRPKL